jgi:hypothetical protein
VPATDAARRARHWRTGSQPDERPRNPQARELGAAALAGLAHHVFTLTGLHQLTQIVESVEAPG